MITVLGKHLDALYLSITFEFPDHLKTLLDALKQEAKDSGDDLSEIHEGIRGVPGGALYIRPVGRGKYQYVMENASLWCAWSTWANMPALQFQFKAETLYENDPRELGEIVEAFVRAWIGPKLIYKAKVTRADLAVDFQQADFELPEMQDVVTRARSRTVHYQGDTANGLTLGKRNQALQAQIYCKSIELEVSEKDWMLDVWERSGRYDPNLAVWRAELRFFREGLRGFGVDTLADFLAHAGDLCEYAIGDTSGSWLRIAGPETRGENTSRRHVTGWWGEVRDAFLADASGTGRKRKGYDPRPSYNRCIELAGAHMARAAALARIGEAKDALSTELRTLATNPAQFGRVVGESYRDHLKTKRLTWADKVNSRTAQMRARVC